MAHLINFKARFAPLVEAGTKRQTMRPPRKRPIYPGDTLRFYSGLRTKSAKFICFAVCKCVRPVTLFKDGIAIDKASMSISSASNEAAKMDKQRKGKKSDWHEHDSKQARAMAVADGFQTYGEMFEFFRDTYDKPSIRLDLIQW